MRPTKKDILYTYWQATKQSRASLCIAIFSVLISNILSIITPVYFKNFFDIITQGTPEKEYAPLFSILVTILVISLFNWFFYRLSDFANNAFQTAVKARLKEHAFSALLRHSYQFFTHSFSGALVRRVNRLSEAFETFADRMLWNALSLVVQVAGMIIILWTQNSMFAIAIVLWLAVFITIHLFLARWKIPYDILRGERDSQNSAVLADALTNHAAIQLFARKEYEFQQFQKSNQSLRAIMRLTWDIGAFIDAIQYLLFMLIEFVVLYLALRAWRSNLITIGTFVLIQTYLGQLFARLWDFGRMLRMVSASFADASEMVDIMREPAEISDVPGAKKLIVNQGSIAFDRVSFSYQQTRKILKNISFEISAGSRVALVGPSGAGKSTITKLILRLHDLESGSIFIDGHNIQKMTQDSLRENIGFVPQEPILFHRTLRENIRYGKPDATDEEIYQAARLAHCDEFICDLPDGYDTLVGERGVTLSGGERQRVAIARTILKNAPILILDEATSSLDSHSELLIQDALAEIMKGKTTIAIAHRLSTIKQMDSILVIKDGQIIERGSHTALIAKKHGAYAQLWKLQSGGFLVETDIS